MAGEFIRQQIRRYSAARQVGAALLLVVASVTVAAAEVSLDLALGRERVYPGEMVPVTVNLSISGDTVRNIGYPRLATSTCGTVAFAPPVEVTDASAPGVTRYRFTGQISSGRPGVMTVGPARLNCEGLESSGGSAAYFGEVEPRQRSLVTESKSLTILPLPAAGRPASFSGAVGIFNIAVSTSPELITVGEPLTIITTIRGDGTLTNGNCPEVKGANLRSYPPRASLTPGALACEQVVVPEIAGDVPTIVWSYFDPGKGRYRTLRKALPEVMATRLSDAAATNVSEAVTKSPPATPATKGSRMLLCLAAAIVLAVAAVVGRIVWRRHHQSSRDVSPASRPSIEQCLALAEQALAEGDVENYYTVIFNVLQEIIVSASMMPASEISEASPINSSSHSAEPSPLVYLLAQCDRVRFGCFVPSDDVIRSDIALFHSLLQPTNNKPT